MIKSKGNIQNKPNSGYVNAKSNFERQQSKKIMKLNKEIGEIFTTQRTELLNNIREAHASEQELTRSLLKNKILFIFFALLFPVIFKITISHLRQNLYIKMINFLDIENESHRKKGVNFKINYDMDQVTITSDDSSNGLDEETGNMNNLNRGGQIMMMPPPPPPVPHHIQYADPRQRYYQQQEVLMVQNRDSDNEAEEYDLMSRKAPSVKSTNKTESYGGNQELINAARQMELMDSSEDMTFESSLITGSQVTGSQATGSQFTGSQMTGSQVTGSQFSRSRQQSKQEEVSRLESLREQVIDEESGEDEEESGVTNNSKNSSQNTHGNMSGRNTASWGSGGQGGQGNQSVGHLFDQARRNSNSSDPSQGHLQQQPGGQISLGNIGNTIPQNSFQQQPPQQQGYQTQTLPLVGNNNTSGNNGNNNNQNQANNLKGQQQPQQQSQQQQLISAAPAQVPIQNQTQGQPPQHTQLAQHQHNMHQQRMMMTQQNQTHMMQQMPTAYLQMAPSGPYLNPQMLSHGMTHPHYIYQNYGQYNPAVHNPQMYYAQQQQQQAQNAPNPQEMMQRAQNPNIVQGRKNSHSRRNQLLEDDEDEYDDYDESSYDEDDSVYSLQSMTSTYTKSSYQAKCKSVNGFKKRRIDYSRLSHGNPGY